MLFSGRRCSNVTSESLGRICHWRKEGEACSGHMNHFRPSWWLSIAITPHARTESEEAIQKGAVALEQKVKWHLIGAGWKILVLSSYTQETEFIEHLLCIPGTVLHTWDSGADKSDALLLLFSFHFLQSSKRGHTASSYKSVIRGWMKLFLWF